ncbi:uncharacterized protein LOC34617666 [Cyclospora cayetanensis]|uniref:Uncharacterized protein LOC34617666 n=1 Tax=Cyclospora cayetanensis TaxID=88456 RepID=A0A6P6RZY7_9EIME|nr:uncharacterized protein LOC34617666 [Cyclospora cayetanensis]
MRSFQPISGAFFVPDEGSSHTKSEGQFMTLRSTSCARAPNGTPAVTWGPPLSGTWSSCPKVSSRVSLDGANGHVDENTGGWVSRSTPFTGSASAEDARLLGGDGGAAMTQPRKDGQSQRLPQMQSSQQVYTHPSINYPSFTGPTALPEWGHRSPPEGRTGGPLLTIGNASCSNSPQQTASAFGQQSITKEHQQHLQGEEHVQQLQLCPPQLPLDTSTAMEAPVRALLQYDDHQVWQQEKRAEKAVPGAPIPLTGTIVADRRVIFYKTQMCPHVPKGQCRLGSRCRFAHKEEELRPPPRLDKTRMCAFVKAGVPCTRGHRCSFAHSREELRHTSAFFKTNICRNWLVGRCLHPETCNHAHGIRELLFFRTLATQSGVRDFLKETTTSRSPKIGAKQELDGFEEQQQLLVLLQQLQQAESRATHLAGHQRPPAPPFSALLEASGIKEGHAFTTEQDEQLLQPRCSSDGLSERLLQTLLQRLQRHQTTGNLPFRPARVCSEKQPENYGLSDEAEAAAAPADESLATQCGVFQQIPIQQSPSEIRLHRETAANPELMKGHSTGLLKGPLLSPLHQQHSKVRHWELESTGSTETVSSAQMVEEPIGLSSTEWVPATNKGDYNEKQQQQQLMMGGNLPDSVAQFGISRMLKWREQHPTY